jgi:hypothetical protein
MTDKRSSTGGKPAASAPTDDTPELVFNPSKEAEPYIKGKDNKGVTAEGDFPGNVPPYAGAFPFRIGRSNRRLVIDFGDYPVQWFAMGPEEARQMITIMQEHIRFL